MNCLGIPGRVDVVYRKVKGTRYFGCAEICAAPNLVKTVELDIFSAKDLYRSKKIFLIDLVLGWR